jgi:hypothetical protein
MTSAYRSVREGQFFESASSPFTQRTERTGGNPIIRKNQASGPGPGQAPVVPEDLPAAKETAGGPAGGTVSAEALSRRYGVVRREGSD